MRSFVGLALLLLAGAVAAIVANVALLGYSDHRNDPIGRLSPKAVVPAGPLPSPAPARLRPRPEDD